MKKIALALTALMALGSTVFADDALILPKNVLRTSIVLINGSADQEYDTDGKAQDLSNAISFWNIGGALEYGITDTLNAAIQWAPGYTFSSKIDGMDTANINSFSDMFIGAKYQFVGPKALVASDTFRIAAAAGMKAAMPSPDFEQAAKDYLAGDDFIVSGTDKNAWGVGARFYADWVANKHFFLNFYSEYVYFFEKKDCYTSFMDPLLGGSKYDVDYGYDLTFEIEPHFAYDLNDTVQLEASVPVNYKMTPEIEYDGVAAADSNTALLKVGPEVGAFVKTALPFYVSAQYQIPVYGVNTNKTGLLVLRSKFFLKF